jgi:hypothetical protein
MKNKNLFIGILVLFTGVVALLSALGAIEFHWSIVVKLWPMILIIVGIAILPLNDYIKGAILLVAFGISCVLYHIEAKHYEGNALSRFYNNVKTWSFYTDDDDEDYDDEDYYDSDDFDYDQHFSWPYVDVEKATLNIEFGAGDLYLGKPCAELVTVDAESNFVNYSFRTEPGDNQTAVFVSGKGHTKNVNKKNTNDLEIALCDQPVWDFIIDMGASDAELDLSPYKVANIEINGGACDLDLKLGNSGCDTKVEINTGASDIDIKIPEGLDCQINIESAITGKDFKGFEKKERGVWQTPNFGQGEHQIVIDMSCAVSDISVERY